MFWFFFMFLSLNLKRYNTNYKLKTVTKSLLNSVYLGKIITK